ncbi:MAG: BlaI/MecI/CopY family transcriptional regulator [Clostridia bacterium]|nr:BlaI/MecI/CopY family transcriptional regulator [Clostridia bacterium]
MTVTKAERSILNLLWKRSPRTLGEIISGIREEHNWSEHTITILLSRLMRKGAIVWSLRIPWPALAWWAYSAPTSRCP